MERGNYQLLIEKLDAFIRKYYVNQLIKGAMYTTALLLVMYLGFNFVEYYLFKYSDVRISSVARTGLFYAFVAATLAALVVWIVLPLTKYFRLGGVISHEKAAEIIGQHFGSVKDKLLNILQLRHQAENTENQSLVLASIDQKSEEIKLVPFPNAIDLSKNRQNLKYVLPPLLLLLIILFAAPSLLRESTSRLINYGKTYERPAPFHFYLDQDTLQVIQYQDFPITVKVDGEALPNEVFIQIDNYEYRLTKLDATTFTYTFNNVQKNTDFKLSSSGVVSENFELDVLKKPNIVDFEVKLDYPDYVGRKNESLNGIGDLTVPVGTNIDWIFDAQNTDAIALQFSEETALNQAKSLSRNRYTYKKKVVNNQSYKLYVSNKQLPNADSINYVITVVPDQYPTISVEQFIDSTNKELLYFAGDASDDYGLLNLSFNYQIKTDKGQQLPLQSLKLKKPEGKQIQYEHLFDVQQLNLNPGDEVTYYFETYDNDGVNGSKPARTGVMSFAMPTIEEYEAMAEENDEDIKENLQKAIEESRKLQQDTKKMRDKMLQKKELDWQDKKELEKLLERQKELEKQIDEAKQAYEENLQNQEEFDQQSEEIMEKQEQLQEMFEEVMSEKMEELMRQIQELMEKLQKDGALEMMEEMQLNDEQTEMELDRMLELFKQLELEQEMTEMVEELEKLAEEQEKLSEETKQSDENKEQITPEQQQQKQEELEEKQEGINEQFEKMQEEMKDIEKKNEELENKRDLGKSEEEMEKIEQQLENSQEQLQKNQNKKASQSQQNAAQQMRRTAQQMAQQMSSMQMEQMQEDMKSLRQLLENLVGLSFDQEDLIKSLEATDVNTPRYVELTQEQFKLKDDFTLIEDSLQALSKRVFQIESFVTEKVVEIKSNMGKSLEDLEQREKPQASERQRRVMKNVNDLALMLSETMQQMQQQMASMMQGNQMCTNPGQSQGQNGQIPKDKISQGQQQLNEQMKEQMQKGKDGKGTSSKDFAQMAARQAALRQALKEKQKELQERGQGSKELEELMEQMNKAEIDLVNKKLSNEMMQRQQDILTRLLENERAEREREYDNQRKAERPAEQPKKAPPSLEEYLKKRQAEVNPYQTISPNLKPYYKSLVEKYVQNLKAQ